MMIGGCERQSVRLPMRNDDWTPASCSRGVLYPVQPVQPPREGEGEVRLVESKGLTARRLSAGPEWGLPFS